MLFAINTFPQMGEVAKWHRAVDAAADLGADAVIMADAGLMAYASERHPQLRLHLSVQGSATHADAIELMRERFNIKRVVLPRVLSLAQIGKLARQTSVELEVFGFGSLCVMAEGRCLLSSYATGDSPNNKGVCSPAHAVRWTEQDGTMHARLSGILIDSYAPGEPAGYPTLCKGRFEVEGERGYVLEEPTSLNALSLLPALLDIGIAAIKIEGRQRSPRYVADVVACCAPPSTPPAPNRRASRHARNGRARSAAMPKATRSRRAPTTGRGDERGNHNNGAIHAGYLNLWRGQLRHCAGAAAVLLAAHDGDAVLCRRRRVGRRPCLSRRDGLHARTSCAMPTGSRSRRCCAKPARRWCCPPRC